MLIFKGRTGCFGAAPEIDRVSEIYPEDILRNPVEKTRLCLLI